MKGQKRVNEILKYIKKRFPKVEVTSIELSYYSNDITIHIKNTDEEVSCFLSFTLKGKGFKVTRIYDCISHLSYYDGDEIETELNIMEMDLK